MSVGLALAAVVTGAPTAHAAASPVHILPPDHSPTLNLTTTRLPGGPKTFHIDGQGFTPVSLVQWQVDLSTSPTTWSPITHRTVQASVGGNPSSPCFAKTCVIVPPGQFHVTLPDACGSRPCVWELVSAFEEDSTGQFDASASAAWTCS